MKSSILLAAQSQEIGGPHVQLPMDPIWFGVIVLAIAFFLMFITLSWRGISYRH